MGPAFNKQGHIPADIPSCCSCGPEKPRPDVIKVLLFQRRLLHMLHMEHGDVSFYHKMTGN